MSIIFQRYWEWRLCFHLLMITIKQHVFLTETSINFDWSKHGNQCSGYEDSCAYFLRQIVDESLEHGLKWHKNMS